MVSYNQLFLYKYKLNNVLLNCSSWKSPISIQSKDIISISIVNNYAANIVPEMVITCNVDYNSYYDILSYAKNLEASFSIFANGSVNYLKENNSADNDVFSTEWVSCTMKATDAGYLYTRDVSENGLDRQSLSPEFNDDSQNQKREIKLYLYDADKLIKYRKNISGVISGNMNDVLFHLLNERNFDNVLMTPATSDAKKDYAVPFGDIGQNLKSLDADYGIYDSRHIFYMGLDRTYLISNDSVGNIVENGELGVVNIYVEGMDDQNNAAMYAGCYKDPENNIYVLASSDLTIDNIDTLQDFSNGGKITSSIFGSQDRDSKIIGEYEIEKSYMFRNEKERLQYLHEIQEGKRIVYIVCNNIDLSIITPNKKFRVIPNKKYYDETYDIEGDYRLLSSTISLGNNGENQFTNSVTLSLIRMVEE